MALGKLKFTLGRNVKPGNVVVYKGKIRRIKEVTDKGVITKMGTFIGFGETIAGWKVS